LRQGPWKEDQTFKLETEQAQGSARKTHKADRHEGNLMDPLHTPWAKGPPNLMLD